jgi:hypothetical protein
MTAREAVSDPAIFFSIYLIKHPPDPSGDERIRVLRQVDAFIEKYGLQPYAPKERPYKHAADIDLPSFSKSAEDFEILLQCHSEYPEPRAGTYYECLAYGYHDALVLQVMITKFKDWSGSLLAGWDELTESLLSCFSGDALAAAHRSMLGVSVVYWAIADSRFEMADQEEQLRVIAEGQSLRHVATDLGAPLWYCERPLFRDCPGVSQDLWALVTPRRAEAHVNPRFYQPRLNGPPHFAITALARHKIAFESGEFWCERENMKRLKDDLNLQVREIVEMQRSLGPELDELRNHNAVEFQRRLAEAGAVLADYGHGVSLFKEMRHTVVVNQRVFLIHSVALISARSADEVELSIDQGEAAARFLGKLHDDEVYSSAASAFQGLCHQLDTDIEYGSSLIERQAATLSSARDQLRIAGERELGEIAHHLSIDSAAVVASVVAVIATEMILKPSEGSIGEPITRWSLTLALIVGSFAITQVLSSGCRGKHLERWSSAIAIGLFGGFLASRYFSPEYFPSLAHFHLHHLHELAALLAGLVAGWLGHSRLKEYRLHATRKTALKNR